MMSSTADPAAAGPATADPASDNDMASKLHRYNIARIFQLLRMTLIVIFFTHSKIEHKNFSYVQVS